MHSSDKVKFHVSVIDTMLDTGKPVGTVNSSCAYTMNVNSLKNGNMAHVYNRSILVNMSLLMQ